MNLEYILSELNSGRPVVIPVKSSNLTTLSYNPFTKQLTVLFSRGTIYKYDNVDIDIVVKLLMSESLGKFFNQNIGTENEVIVEKTRDKKSGFLKP